MSDPVPAAAPAVTPAVELPAAPSVAAAALPTTPEPAITTTAEPAITTTPAPALATTAEPAITTTPAPGVVPSVMPGLSTPENRAHPEFFAAKVEAAKTHAELESKVENTKAIIPGQHHWLLDELLAEIKKLGSLI
jgi:hypothetical protein